MRFERTLVVDRSWRPYVRRRPRFVRGVRHPPGIGQTRVHQELRHLAHDHVYASVLEPRLDIQPDPEIVLTPVKHPRHDRNVPALPLPDLIHRLPDPPHELVHGRNARVHFIRTKVHRAEHEVEFDAVGAVVFHHLTDQRQLVIVHQFVGEVVCPPVRVVLRSAEADVLAMPPLEPAAALGALGVCRLKSQVREEAQPVGPGVRDRLLYLVGAHLRGVLDHPHDPPVDVVLPHILGLSDGASDLALMEIDVAVAHAHHEQIDTRPKHLVHRPSELAHRQGRFDPLPMKVVSVVVVDQSRSIHQRLPPDVVHAPLGYHSPPIDGLKPRPI